MVMNGRDYWVDAPLPEHTGWTARDYWVDAPIPPTFDHRNYNQRHHQTIEPVARGYDSDSHFLGVQKHPIAEFIERPNKMRTLTLYVSRDETDYGFEGSMEQFNVFGKGLRDILRATMDRNSNVERLTLHMSYISELSCVTLNQVLSSGLSSIRHLDIYSNPFDDTFSANTIQGCLYGFVFEPECTLETCYLDRVPIKGNRTPPRAQWLVQ